MLQETVPMVHPMQVQESPAHPRGGEIPQGGMLPSQVGVVASGEGYYSMPGGLFVPPQQQLPHSQQSSRSRSQAIPILPPKVRGLHV